MNQARVKQLYRVWRLGEDFGTTMYPLSNEEPSNASNFKKLSPSWMFTSANDTESSSSVSSWRPVKFSALHEALSRMNSLPESHSFYVDEATVKTASDLLGAIAENSDAPTPKIFPQDGDSVTLTWEDGPLKRYLIVSGRDVDLMDLNLKNNMRCEQQMSDDGNIMYDRLFSDLGFSTGKAAI